MIQTVLKSEFWGHKQRRVGWHALIQDTLFCKRIVSSYNLELKITRACDLASEDLQWCSTDRHSSYHLSSKWNTMINVCCTSYCWTLNIPWLPKVFLFFFFLIWVLRPFQEHFTYIKPIVHQRLAKTREAGEKTTWPSISRTWLSHVTWARLELQGWETYGLRVNSPIH